jgi:hypothetical protein
VRETKARVSILESAGEERAYGQVLLVRPTGSRAEPDFEAVGQIAPRFRGEPVDLQRCQGREVVQDRARRGAKDWERFGQRPGTALARGLRSKADQYEDEQ